MKNRSLVAGIRLTFTWIIITSMIVTIITYVFAACLYFRAQNNSLYPANYYEQQIPKIDAYIREENVSLLSGAEEEHLKNVINGNGIAYQVLDNHANMLYGTNQETLFKSKEDLLNQLNTTISHQGKFIHTVPIIDKNNNIAGAIALSYQLKVSYAESSGHWVITVMILALLSPFFYMIGFTLLFSKLFVKNINYPLQLLMDASRKIKEKNLDFDIHYHSNNELGKLCDAFSEMKDELKKSLSVQWGLEQERVEMVESLAHDLKTPLSIIRGYSEALINTEFVEDKKLHTYLNVIKENAVKSSNLVQQLQYTSDLEKTDFPLQLTQVNLFELLKKKITHYQLQAEQNKIKLTLETKGKISEPFLIDEERLERILDNIISNSLTYTPYGGKIDIFVKDEDEKIFYRICDSGSGFHQKDLDKAFDKFYRGDEARRSKGGHSGLGLYNVQQLIEQLGGTIEIANAKTGGACVTFWHKKYND